MQSFLRIVQALMMSAVFTLAYAESKEIQPLTNLQQLASQAKAQKLPILLVVSQHHCPFCVKLKKEVLNPMVLSGDYTDRVIMTELLLDDDADVVNLAGKSVYPGSIAADYQVWMTPTLLFIDADGVEVARRMLGVNTVEMYGYYLDESLDAALQAVKKGPPYDYKLQKKHLNSSD